MSKDNIQGSPAQACFNLIARRLKRLADEYELNEIERTNLTLIYIKEFEGVLVSKVIKQG